MSGIVSYLVFFLIQALVFAVVCLGLNLQWGYTGLFNIGVAGFYLVGAYAFALLCGPTHAGIVAGKGGGVNGGSGGRPPPWPSPWQGKGTRRVDGSPGAVATKSRWRMRSPGQVPQ